MSGAPRGGAVQSLSSPVRLWLRAIERIGREDLMRHIMIGLAVSLALVSAGRPVDAATADPHYLGLGADAFPAGALITHEHIDRTAAAVDAEGLVGQQNAQGEFYQRLHVIGSLFESARLPMFDGSTREVWLLASLFPSPSAAAQAFTADARFSQCDESPVLRLPVRSITCAYTNSRGPESGMYVVATSGPVEFIIVGFVHEASVAARLRAERDSAYLAVHEVNHVQHVIALGLLRVAP